MRPDSESKETGKDTEGDEEVEEGGKEEVPGGSQHQHQVWELNLFQGLCKYYLRIKHQATRTSTKDNTNITNLWIPVLGSSIQEPFQKHIICWWFAYLGKSADRMAAWKFRDNLQDICVHIHPLIDLMVYTRRETRLET